jgi:hypothetical protein
MSLIGRVTRVTPVQTAMRNCTRDEGGPFEFGKPTGATLTGSLESIREAFAAAGHVCLPREERDEPQIVESWL